MKLQATDLIAFLVAAAMPPIVGAFFTLPAQGFDFGTVAVFAVIAYLLSAAISLVAGVPVYLLLLRSDLVRWWSALGAGLGIGVIVAVLLRLPTLAQPRDILVLGLEGATAGLAFWVVWSRRRAG
jgi:hypothetical protein